MRANPEPNCSAPPTDLMNYQKCVSKISLQLEWQISTGCFDRPIMAQILILARTKVGVANKCFRPGLFCRYT